MPFTFNGVGTTFYGARDFALDETYTTTEWFTFLYIPVIPLRSLRIRDSNKSNYFVVYSSRQYAVYSKSRPDVKQVFSIYGWLAAVVCSALLEKVPIIGQIPFLPGTLIAALAFLPWILRRRARKRLILQFQTSRRNDQTSPPKSNTYDVVLQARLRGWDSEVTQREMEKVLAQKKGE
jgi:hypothetical protein